MKTPNFFKT